MQPTLHQIYFSPTGTTHRVVDAISHGFSPHEIFSYDLTMEQGQLEKRITDGVALFACPVYAGRVPIDFLTRIASITADEVPAILVAVYGNREFEDTLVELCNVVMEKGFRVIAAAAFIGEHSFSTPDGEIAAGRPHDADIEMAEDFGEQVAKKIAGQDFSLPKIEGNVPYVERKQFGGLAPETDMEKCTLCGMCAAVCPKQIITVADEVHTDAANCIMCSACIKVCPDDARDFDHPMVRERRQLLLKICSTPKIPKFFL